MQDPRCERHENFLNTQCCLRPAPPPAPCLTRPGQAGCRVACFAVWGNLRPGGTPARMKWCLGGRNRARNFLSFVLCPLLFATSLLSSCSCRHTRSGGRRTQGARPVFYPPIEVGQRIEQRGELLWGRRYARTARPARRTAPPSACSQREAARALAAHRCSHG